MNKIIYDVYKNEEFHFHKCEAFHFHKNESLYDIILINKNNICLHI